MTACPAHCPFSEQSSLLGMVRVQRTTAFGDLRDVQAQDGGEKLYAKPDPVHDALSIFCWGEAE